MMTPEGSGGGAHDHGGGEMKKNSGQQSGTELPKLFKTQLHMVLSVADVVGNEIEAEDVAKIKRAFLQLGLALKDVDMSLVTGHTHMLWMEYEMRLTNDASEGMLADNLKDARKVYDSLVQNTDGLKNKFGLMHMDHAKKESRQISMEFRKQLGNVLESYYAIQRALAGDDVQGTIKAFKATLNSLKTVDMKLLSDDDHDAWMKTASQLNRILTDALSKEDIQALREDFHLLSQNLTQAIKKFGVSGTTSIYILKCPMAFDNAGANWLQDNKDVSNPYFGEMMLKCGSVEDMIPVMTPSESEEQ
jgi:Cu(I)/Ag(I) efflux system membrane fusion protein